MEPVKAHFTIDIKFSTSGTLHNNIGYDIMRWMAYGQVWTESVIPLVQHFGYTLRPSEGLMEFTDGVDSWFSNASVISGAEGDSMTFDVRATHVAPANQTITEVILYGTHTGRTVTQPWAHHTVNQYLYKGQSYEVTWTINVTLDT
jgi:hypothetical protein